MQFKFIVFTFCLIQAHDWRATIVSAYPQPINAPKDNTQQKQQTQTTDGGNREAEVVEFQIHKNQIHVDGQNDKGDACLQKKRVGRCKASIPKYYYNQGTGRCEMFLYGGCGGSSNRFDSLTDCEQNCAKHLRANAPITIHNDGDQSQNQSELNTAPICELPHTEEGSSCKGYVPRWTYNPDERKCVQFMFQGCGATKNNFQTKPLCDTACGDYNKSSDSANFKSGSSAVCKFPMNPGPCYALYDRYYFNQVNNRCERFMFGGCGGNENNFKTADECVRTCGGDEPAHDASCSNVDCPWSRYTHYTALGCKPIYDSNACCPTRFDCPDSNITSTQTEPKCRYQGTLYAIGETIKEAASVKDCRAACTCINAGNKARIQCVSIECPEQLGVVPPGKESCHRLYKRGGCCVNSYYCAQDTHIEDPAKDTLPLPPVEPHECNFEGKTYFEGERMYPQKSKCLKCLCQKGFDGNLTEEFCDKVDCGIEIYYADKLERGCAPVYLQDANGVDSCCPISWQCPDEQKITLPVMPRPRPNSTGQAPAAQTVPLPPGPITILPIPFGTNNFTAISGKISEPLTASACALPKVVGPCRAKRPRFFFNTVTSKCENFTYGGCQGNQNNFVVLADCERVCEANSNQIQEFQEEEGTTEATQIMSRSGPVQIQPVPLPTTYKLTETDPCEQPARTGPCRAYLPRYYFSPQENSCKFFIYGGCKGNENNFYSQASCEAKCLNRVPEESLRYDHSQNNALRSSVGGGNGDSSQVTFEDGQEHARAQQWRHQRPSDFKIIDVTPPKSICSLRAETGRCKAHIKRFYFDGTQCSLFTYGGCGGNANNFRDLDECNFKCGGMSIAPVQQILQQSFKSPKWRSTGAQIQPVPVGANQNQAVVFGGTERCQLPPKVGSCYGQFKAYYYDVVTHSCQNFTYGGCFGNTNRFVTLEECKATCERPLALERQNELTFARSGNADDAAAHILPVPKPDDKDGQGKEDVVAHILPVTQPDDEDGQSTSIHRRQLMPGEVIAIQPTSMEKPTTEKAQAVTVDIDNGEDILEEKVFCGLAPETGPCKHNELRYFWDSSSQTCLPFFFGGCRGNKNNFLSESDCLSVCGAGPTLEQMTQDGVLSCSFGNETFTMGATLGQFTSRMELGDNTNADIEPCGVPICSCQTPPTLTCIQKTCDNPAQRVTLPRIDNMNGDDNDNNGNATTGKMRFEVQSVSTPPSSPTPSWSKPVDKIGNL